jgi:hypothetical protein
MGSRGPKQRKKHTHLDKVPQYEEPNTFPLGGLSNQQGPNPGRFGHDADHHHGTKKPGRFGSLFIRLLGKKPGEHI